MAKKLEDMTVDELDELTITGKVEVEKIKEKLRAVHAVRSRKVDAERIQDRINAAGLKGVVAVIAPAELKVEGK